LDSKLHEACGRAGDASITDVLRLNLEAIPQGQRNVSSQAAKALSTQNYSITGIEKVIVYYIII
jgi:hypothetical protein